MPAPKQTKKQRIEEAREAARLAREKREKRQKLLKVLVPTLVSIGVLAIVAVIVIVIAIQPKPAAAFPGGPKNMASDGVVYTQSGSTLKYVPTAALKKGEKPKAPEVGSADIPHVVTYVDLSCPACKAFESTYSSQLQKMVSDGDITLEIKPISIVRAYSTNYADRSGNLAACVANYQPGKFLDVLTTLYENQAEEQSAGLSNDKMISLIRAAGVKSGAVEACVRGDSFSSWLTAATKRATSNSSLVGPDGFATPTVTVDGQLWDRTDLPAFIQKVAAQS